MVECFDCSLTHSLSRIPQVQKHEINLRKACENNNKKHFLNVNLKKFPVISYYNFDCKQFVGHFSHHLIGTNLNAEETQFIVFLHNPDIVSAASHSPRNKCLHHFTFQLHTINQF